MPSLPSFPAPDLQGVLDAISEVFNDLVNEGTGTITNITQSVLDIWEMDCGGKWVIYVNTATVAATRALWLLLTPSLDEILENYLEPKPGRRHGRRGQRGDRQRRRVPGLGYRLFFRPPIPDIDESIADLVPGREALRGRRMAPGEWIFWTSINVADAILWHWLLLEATETFTTTWQSELMQSGECKAANDGSCQFTTAKQTPFFNNDLWFNKTTLSGLFEENLNVSNNGLIALPAANTQGRMLLIILAHWELHTTPTSDYGSFNPGVRVTAWNAFNQVVDTKELRTTISGGQGSQTAALLDFGMLTDDVQRISCAFLEPTTPGPDFTLFECWAELSMAVRGVEIV